MIPSILIGLGLLIVALGLISVLIPLRFLGIASRRLALLVIVCGIVLVLCGVHVPPTTTRVAPPVTGLDQALPTYQARERHAVRVHASPQQIFQAIHAVTPLEIGTLDALYRLRNLRSRAPARKHALLDRGMIEIMHRAGFITLRDDEPRELVLGAVGRFWGPHASILERGLEVKGSPNIGASVRMTTPEEFSGFGKPGYAKAAVDFRVLDEGGGWCRVTTETRALGTDDRARKEFQRTWNVVAPGTAVVRGQWLDAIKKRAEAVADSSRNAPGKRS